MGMVDMILDILGLRPLTMVLDLAGWFLPLPRMIPSLLGLMVVLFGVIVIATVMGAVILVVALGSALLAGPFKRMCPIGGICPIGRLFGKAIGPWNEGR